MRLRGIPPIADRVEIYCGRIRFGRAGLGVLAGKPRIAMTKSQFVRNYL
jgi:hypothetical protein